MKMFKTMVICGLLVGVILMGIGLLEVGLLKLLGLQYTTVGALMTFFLIYLLLEVPLSLIVDSLPRALKTVGVIQSSKGWLSLILDTSLSFILIITIDYFMASISISWHGVLLFALVSGLIGSKVKEDNPEPPLIDSDEFKDFHNKIQNKRYK